MSSTSPRRPIGVSSAMARSSFSSRKGSSAEVLTAPTARALTRTRGANSAASCRVMNESAALAVP